MRAVTRVVQALLVCLLPPLCAACARAPVAPLTQDVIIEVRRAADVPPGYLLLKPVPGGLLGRTLDIEMFRAPAEAALAVPLDGLLAGLDAHARILRSDALNPGELVTPRETRIARVGTFFEPLARRVGGCNNYRTALRAPISTMLVYVDRAARVHGTRYLAPYVMQYELEFPEAGLYAVNLRREGLVLRTRVAGKASLLTADVRRTGCPLRHSPRL